MPKLKTINIRGKEYVTVATRVEAFHGTYKEGIGIVTEVLNHTPVVIKATVKTPKGIFTGISAANPAKTIEKMSPYEVAETSAVGRALGFAGIGITDSIASADELYKAQNTPLSTVTYDKGGKGRIVPQIHGAKKEEFDLTLKRNPLDPLYQKQLDEYEEEVGLEGEPTLK